MQVRVPTKACSSFIFSFFLQCRHNLTATLPQPCSNLATTLQQGCNSQVAASLCDGKVLGYPYHTLDAFIPQWTGNKDIEDNYFDGISVTCGPAGSRQHIFSLAATTNYGGICPCARDSSYPNSQPDFVGDDYYCESGASGADDILWDGEDCDTEADCCTSPYMPFFYKNLNRSTTDDIELRILPNQDFADENLYLLAYEFYVK